jgi:hypothetical protein
VNKKIYVKTIQNGGSIFALTEGIYQPFLQFGGEKISREVFGDRLQAAPSRQFPKRIPREKVVNDVMYLQYCNVN